MKKILRHLFLFFWTLCVASRVVWAQDADLVYQTDGKTLACKIASVSAKKIVYRSPQNPGMSYAMNTADALLAFSSSGNYIAFPFDGSASTEAGFLNPPNRKNGDVVVTADQTAFAVTSLQLTDKELKYTPKSKDKKPKEQKLPKAKLVAIFYKTGKYQLFVEPKAAAFVLRSVKAQVDALTGVDNTQKTATTADSGPAQPADEDLAFPGTPEEFEGFRKKALAKVEEFGQYIATIVDPKSPTERTNATIDLAITLFLNEEVRVEVSNVNTGTKNKYKIREYLRRLKIKGADYQSVEVAYADIGYATDFVRGPDGNYYGVVSFVQTFKGLVDNKIIYGDITQRNVTVILKLYEKAVEGQKKKMWDVFLADIGIEETRKL